MAKVKRMSRFAYIEQKLMAQKLLSERVKNKIHTDYADRLERILIGKTVQGAFRDDSAGISFPELFKQRVRRSSQKRKPPSDKQLAALKRGRKILRLNQRKRFVAR